MGSPVYDFLTESFLFDSTLHDDRFGGIPDADLFEELQKYRQFCIAQLDVITSDAADSPDALKVFTGLNEVEVQTLKQSALYVHQYVLSDPLFPFSEEQSTSSSATASYLGYENSGLDRSGLVAALRRMKILTPMVAANYVKFLPVSRLFEAPTETPIYWPSNQFADTLPPDALKYLRGKAIVKSLQKSSRGAGWTVEDGLKRSRGIIIDFEDDDDRNSHVYHCLQQEVVKMDEETGRAVLRFYLPSEPPSTEMFQAWVIQSVNRAAGDIYARTQTEFAMSAGLGMSFLTSSPLVNELLTRFFPTEKRSSVNTANIVLNIDVPFLENISTENLMRVRSEEGEAFENFRNELTNQLWDLQSEPDALRRNEKARKVLHNLGRTQTHQLEMKAKGLQKGALSEVVVLTAALTGSIMANATPTAAVLAAGSALAGVAKIVSAYREAIRSSPVFFLWKTMRK